MHLHERDKLNLLFACTFDGIHNIAKVTIVTSKRKLFGYVDAD